MCMCCLCRLHVESVLVQTATGPGGISGPLRVDLEGRYSYNVMVVRSPRPAGPVLQLTACQSVCYAGHGPGELLCSVPGPINAAAAWAVQSWQHLCSRASVRATSLAAPR